MLQTDASRLPAREEVRVAVLGKGGDAPGIRISLLAQVGQPACSAHV